LGINLSSPLEGVATPGGGAAGSPFKLWPQLLQNFAPAGCVAPQFGQARANLAPQLEQNFAFSGFSVLQDGQFIVTFSPMHDPQVVEFNCLYYKRLHWPNSSSKSSQNLFSLA
jgi:hypothetical protein